MATRGDARLSCLVATVSSLLAPPLTARAVVRPSQAPDRSTDGSGLWTSNGPDGGEGFEVAAAADPADAGVVYVGTAGGVYASTDGGATWFARRSGLSSTELYVGSLAV